MGVRGRVGLWSSGLAACSNASDAGGLGSGGSCIAGRESVCWCQGGASGIQTCNADGRSYTACACQGVGSAGTGSAAAGHNTGAAGTAPGGGSAGSCRTSGYPPAVVSSRFVMPPHAAPRLPARPRRRLRASCRRARPRQGAALALRPAPRAPAAALTPPARGQGVPLRRRRSVYASHSPSTSRALQRVRTPREKCRWFTR